MRHDRRAFIRHAVRLGGGSVLGGIAGCVGNRPDLDLSGDGGGSPDDEILGLQSGMEIGLLFSGPLGLTSSSEVNPDEPGGGRLVRVDDVETGQEVTLSWRQTVEREDSGSAASATETNNTTSSNTQVVEQTGTITARGLAAAHRPLLPMYWEPGTTTTDTSAIWLSQEAFAELEDRRRTQWSEDPLTRISWVGKEAQERIHSGAAKVDEVMLEAEPDPVDYELTIDGQRTTIRAINAHDSFGNEYVIAANEANPLVVKFRFDAVSVGFTGFDTALWTLIKAVFTGYQVATLDFP